MRKGFTLIEIMVVVAIIALLMALTIPIVGRIGGSARIATTQARITDVSRAVEMYKSVFGVYPRDYIEGFSYDASESESESTQIRKKSTAVLILALTHSHVDEPTSMANCPCKGRGPFFDQVKLGENALLLEGDNIETVGLPTQYQYSFLTFTSIGEDDMPGRPAIILIDPWGNPLVYDEKMAYRNRIDGNPSEPLQYSGADRVGVAYLEGGTYQSGDMAYKQPFLLFSYGPDGVDNTHHGSLPDNIRHGDDLGNW